MSTIFEIDLFQVEMAQDYIIEPIVFFLCVGIAIELFRQRSGTASRQLFQKEKNAIYFVFTICISLMLLNVIYLVISYITSNKWSVFAGNSLWIIVCGTTEI